MPAAECFSVWFWLFWPECAIAARRAAWLNPMWFPVMTELRGGLRGLRAVSILRQTEMACCWVCRIAASFGAGIGEGYVQFV